MKLILVIFLVYFIVGIYSQEESAADVQAESNINAEEVKNDTKGKVNSTRTTRNYSNMF
jgi:hypothetical protein